MNSWGGLPISVFTETTSYSDPTLVRAHDNLRTAASRHRHADPYHAVLDNPRNDGPGLRANLWVGGGKKRFTFPGRIELVVTEAQCDAACADLRGPDLSAHVTLYWDTESIAYVNGGGQNTSTAALVQILKTADVCYLFRVALWPSCYGSFASLIGSANVEMMAHFVSHDVADLQRRFPGHTIRGTSELTDLTDGLGYSSRGLHQMVAEEFDQWLDKKRVDHRLWGCGRLLEGHQIYGAADPWAVACLAKAALERDGSSPPPFLSSSTASAEASDDDDDEPRARARARAAVSRHHSSRCRRAAVDDSSDEELSDLVMSDEEDGDDDDDAAVAADDDGSRDAGSAGGGGDGGSAGGGSGGVRGGVRGGGTGGGGTGGPNVPEGSLLEQAKQQIERYAQSSDEADLVLSTSLSKADRTSLHPFIDKFHLQHHSAGEGADRCLIVQRYRPFVVVTAAQAETIVGSLVAKDQPGAAFPTRGRVASYLSDESRWLLQYPNSSEPNEKVDVDLLNIRLRRRATHDHGQHGLDGTLPSAGDATEATKLLEQLEKGISPTWKEVLPRYDVRHWMANMAMIMGMEKGTPAFNLFMSLLSDAVFWILPGEADRVRAHCIALGMDEEQIAKLPRQYWRRRCRYSCPQPRLILRGLVDIYLFFRDMPDPLKPA